MHRRLRLISVKALSLDVCHEIEPLPPSIRSKLSLLGRTSNEKSASVSIFAKQLAAALIGGLLILTGQPPAHASFETLILSPHRTTKESLQQDVGNLPLLSPVQRELKGGETHSYQVILMVGQFLYAEVEQQGIDLVVDVFDPGGQKIADAIVRMTTGARSRSCW
jgi:hypothetical protein